MQDSRVKFAPQDDEKDPTAAAPEDQEGADEEGAAVAGEEDFEDIEDFGEGGDDEGDGLTAEQALAQINESLRDLVSADSAKKIERGGQSAQDEITALLEDEDTPPAVKMALRQAQEATAAAQRVEQRSRREMEERLEKEFKAERKAVAKQFGLTKQERFAVDRYMERLAHENPRAAEVLTYEEAGVRALGRARFSGQRPKGGAAPKESGAGKPPAKHIVPGSSPSGPQGDPEITHEMTMNQVGSVFGSLYEKGRG